MNLTKQDWKCRKGLVLTRKNAFCLLEHKHISVKYIFFKTKTIMYNVFFVQQANSGSRIQNKTEKTKTIMYNVFFVQQANSGSRIQNKTEKRQNSSFTCTEFAHQIF